MIGNFTWCIVTISSHIVLDPITQKSKRFGFVQLSNAENGRLLIAALDGKKLASGQIIRFSTYPFSARSIAALLRDAGNNETKFMMFTFVSMNAPTDWLWSDLRVTSW